MADSCIFITFACATTERLSCHVEQFVGISPSEVKLQKDWIPIKFELQWNDH